MKRQVITAELLKKIYLLTQKGLDASMIADTLDTSLSAVKRYILAFKQVANKECVTPTYISTAALEEACKTLALPKPQYVKSTAIVEEQLEIPAVNNELIEQICEMRRDIARIVTATEGTMVLVSKLLEELSPEFKNLLHGKTEV